MGKVSYWSSLRFPFISEESGDDLEQGGEQRTLLKLHPQLWQPRAVTPHDANTNSDKSVPLKDNKVLVFTEV